MQSNYRLAPTAIGRNSRKSYRSIARFAETERVGTILGSDTFAVSLSYQTNPALPASFPWLSAHASLYEKWKPTSITYKFTPTVGTDANGQVLMSYDYDTLDAAPVSSIQLTQSTVYATGSIWRPLSLTIPIRGGKEFFTRRGVPQGNATHYDLKMYDLGQLFICTEGCSDNIGTTLGYVEVVYNLQLIDKQPNVAVPVTINSVDNSLTEAFLGAPGTSSPLSLNTKYTFDPIGNSYNTVGAPGTLLFDSIPYADGVMTLDPSSIYIVKLLIQFTTTQTHNVTFEVHRDDVADDNLVLTTSQEANVIGHTFAVGNTAALECFITVHSSGATSRKQDLVIIRLS
jgi:hypothetical protein